MNELLAIVESSIIFPYAKTQFIYVYHKVQLELLNIILLNFLVKLVHKVYRKESLSENGLSNQFSCGKNANRIRGTLGNLTERSRHLNYVF